MSNFIQGTSENENFDNEAGWYGTLDAGAGDDTIYETSGNASLNGGSGNDSILVTNERVTIVGGTGKDTINTDGDSAVIIQYANGDGNDLVKNWYERNILQLTDIETYSGSVKGNDVIISAGTGKITLEGAKNKLVAVVNKDGFQTNKVYTGQSTIDAIYNASIDSSGWNVALDTIVSGTNGNDFIYNYGYKSLLSPGDGNDTIKNYVSDVIILSGAGDDSIYTENDSMIRAGRGNDTIELWKKSGYNVRHHNIIQYSAGDGDDVIYNYVGTGDSWDDTIQIFDNVDYSIMTSGNDVIITVGDGSLTLKDAKGKKINIDKLTMSTDSKSITLTESANNYINILDGATIQALGGNDFILNRGNNVSVDGGADNDDIENYNGTNVTINAGEGNDGIDNFGQKVTIDGGAGNDDIWNYDDIVSINGGNDDDYIVNNGYSSTIDGGAGNDYICNNGGTINVTILGGDGDDKITNYGDYALINGGAGDDSISLESSNKNVSIKYVSGDGNDIIYGFSADSTLSISGGSYSTTKSGDNIIVTVGEGKISLMGAASLSAVNIDSTEEKAEENSWKLSGTTATYGTTSNTLIKLTNIKSLDGLNLSGNVVTVSKAAVNAKKITLTGTGYTLALADDVTKRTTKKAAWSYSSGTATYKSSYKTAGYTLASNAKSIKYSKAETPLTLATVKGVKSKSGLSVSGNVITVSKASVNAKKITLSGDGYTLALADDVTKTTTKKAAWSYSDGTATYKSSYKTAGYTLSSNAKSITYTAATKASTLATVKGVKSKSGLSVSGNVITVAKSSVNAKKITLSGDDYTLALADGLAPTTKKAEFTISGTTATYKSSYKTAGYKLASNGKSITYSKATTATNLATIKGAASATGLSVSGSKITLKKSALKNKVTVSGAYEFDFASDYKNATISGTAKADTITARGTNISINGGAGNDTIKLFGKSTVTGGDGSDIFVYNKGSDVVADYAAEDMISIASGTAVTSTSGNDLILTVDSGKITVTGGNDGKAVTYYDDGGKHTYQKASDTLEGVKITKSGKVVTLTDDYGEDTFKVADLSKVVTINAAKVPRGLEITANSNSNSITGTDDDDKIYGLEGADTIKSGKGSDYIEGGKGDDEIYGGTGSDTLWGSAGDDTLTGGAGNDVFVYGNGDGHDIITDYADIDRIMILSDKKPALAYTPSSNNMTFNIGNGSIVIENPQGQNINFIKRDGSYLHHEAVIRSAK